MIQKSVFDKASTHNFDQAKPAQKLPPIRNRGNFCGLKLWDDGAVKIRFLNYFRYMLKWMGLVSLLLFSCSKPNHWAVDQIHSDKAEYSFAKISYPAADPVNGIDVEFVNNSDRIQAYLTVHSTQVKPIKEDPQSVAVSIRCQKEKFSCTAYRFQGGQKFLLNSEISEKIISLLKNKQEITILLNGYRTVLKPADFEQKYETFLHPRLLRNPFQFSL